MGLPFPGQPGPHNAITDIPGVRVGYRTLISERVRTGVTAILPRGFATELRPAWSGFFALNGNGELTGTHWIEDAGYFCGPICLTNTHSVGIVHHAASRWMIGHHAPEFRDDHVWAMPVVAETYDGVLNEINAQQVTEADVLAAIRDAGTGAIAEGNVGGGTGMICYEFKGGTGTASRVVTVGSAEYTVGVLVQANHGIRDWLTILGVPVGLRLNQDRLFQSERGSIIVAIGSDAPMMPHQLRRVAKRAALGIGRNGTPGGNNSGDMFLAFSTANDIPLKDLRAQKQHSFAFLPDESFDPFYLAT
ncbi:MAG TPA: P1 family peptidase, partial [Nitrospiraceae bacterium]|nr:P1 family peptidase [Nitrospiraceae bacterium]